MPFYKTCPECGANLDPDERCDCRHQPAEKPASAAKSRTDLSQSTKKGAAPVQKRKRRFLRYYGC